MNFKRRQFIKTAGAVAAGISLPSFASNLFAENQAQRSARVFGIQLYGLRDMMGKDAKHVIKTLATQGYNYVESFDSPQGGLYFGMGNKNFKALLDDVNLKMHSLHTNILHIDFEKKVEEAASINVKYLLYGWEGPGKTLDDYKKMADDFNAKGAFCKQHGICFGFHNHDFTFKEIDGLLPQEILLDRTDKNLVDFQVDFYWVITGRKDPVAHINKYPDRYKLCHFKDRSQGATEREGTAICELGTGAIDFASILAQTKSASIKYYIVDQDNCNDRQNPFACTQTDADYMKQLKW